MKHKKTMILTTALCLSPILMGLAVYDQLPEMVPTHFDIHGVPNGWSSRPMAVFGLPILMAVLNLLCHWGFVQMQKRDKGRKVAPDILMKLCFWVPAFISVVLVPMTLLMALGKDVPMVLVLELMLGITFLLVGNYLPKCRMNGYIGIKVPWTYHSEEIWNKTHRMGGFVWVVAGIAMLVNIVIRSELLMLAMLLAAVLIPIGYSYLLYRREKE